MRHQGRRRGSRGEGEGEAQEVAAAGEEAGVAGRRWRRQERRRGGTRVRSLSRGGGRRPGFSIAAGDFYTLYVFVHEITKMPSVGNENYRRWQQQFKGDVAGFDVPMSSSGFICSMIHTCRFPFFH